MNPIIEERFNHYLVECGKAVKPSRCMEYIEKHLQDFRPGCTLEEVIAEAEKQWRVAHPIKR